jgi:hypothetical protein
MTRYSKQGYKQRFYDERGVKSMQLRYVKGTERTAFLIGVVVCLRTEMARQKAVEKMKKNIEG